MLKCVHLWKTRIVGVNVRFRVHVLFPTSCDVFFTDKRSGKRSPPVVRKAPQSSPAPGPPRWLCKGTGEQPRAGSPRQVPARHQAAPASKQGSAYTQTSGHFFPSHFLDTILCLHYTVRQETLFSPSYLKVRAHSNWHSGAHYQLALVFSSCANHAVLTMILS